MISPAKIKVGIADDHEIFRDGLKLILTKAPSIELVFEARNGEELVEFSLKHEPDVVLTDIVMPVLDGIAAVKKICQERPAVACVALSMFNEESLIVDMLEAGANGYLIKNAGRDEIIEAIHSVHNRQPYYCRASSAKLAKMISQSRYNPYLRKKSVEFTDKELTIIKLVCQEKTNKEIADVMFLSTRTVEGYRLKILEKMDVKSTAGIVVYAIKNGLYKVTES